MSLSRLPDFDVDAAFTIMATKAFVAGMVAAQQDSCGGQFLCPQFFDVSNRGFLINEKARSQSNGFTPVVNGRYQNGDLRGDQIQYNVFRYNLDRTFSKVCTAPPQNR